MRITVNDKLKIIQIWLCKNEVALPHMVELDEYKNYRKVIYRSGTGDLLNNTKILLKRNLEAC